MCYTDGDDSPPSHLKVQVRLYYVYVSRCNLDCQLAASEVQFLS